MGFPAIMRSLRAWAEAVLTLCILAITVIALAAFGKARLTAAIYERRLGDVQQAYVELRDQYNHAVKRTAVTELRVTEEQLNVVVRDDTGGTHEIPTACDPRKEVYVDYVVLEGRLWIRRVFDDATEPRHGTLIDPSLGAVAWDDRHANVGKAVYRQLSPGRWVVTVTGNGSLGLEKATRRTAAILRPAPRITDPAVVRARMKDATSQISVTEMLAAAFARHGHDR